MVRSSSSPRVPFANARLRPTRLAATHLDSLSASVRRRSRRSCPPSFRTMDGFASRRNCSSSSALRLAAIVIRKAANCSLEKRKSKRCPQRAFYGARGRFASSSSSSAAGTAQAQTKPPVVTAAESESTSSQAPRPAGGVRPLCWNGSQSAHERSSSSFSLDEVPMLLLSGVSVLNAAVAAS